MSGLSFGAVALAAAAIGLAIGYSAGNQDGRNDANEEYRRADPPPPCLDTATAIGVNAAAEDDAHCDSRADMQVEPSGGSAIVICRCRKDGGGD